MTTLTAMVDALIQQASGQHSALADAGFKDPMHGQVLGLGTKHDPVTHTDPAHIDRTVVNQVIDSALGGLAGGNMHEHAFAQPERQASFMLKLIPLVLHWIKQQGGLNPALKVLRQTGLEAQVASWVGPGINDRITPDMLDDLFASDSIEQLAQQFGISTATAHTGLAVVLPQVIDILTSASSEDLSHADIETNNVLTRLSHL